MDISDWIDPAAIVIRSRADSKRQALAVVAETAARSFKVKASEVLDALLEREAQGSTGVGRGVAVPHATLKDLRRMRAVVVRLDRPVAFGALDEQPVDILVGLFAPEGASGEHLRALARISRILRQGDARERIRQARTPEAVLAVLSRESEMSAA